MGRPLKEGLDYFELDCQLDDKTRLIQAEFGLKGFAIVVKLYQKIYGGHGYYCEWDDDTILLFMSENGLDSEKKSLIKSITDACIRRGLFSKELYTKYGILTSHGIQKRYINAVSRRESVKMEKAYLLVEVAKNNISVDGKTVNVCRNSENVDGNGQRRVEKSREEKEKILEKKAASPIRGKSAVEFIEEMQFGSEVTEALKDWVKYKIEKGRGYGAVGLRKLLEHVEKMLAQYGDKAVADIIVESIASGYEGIAWANIGNGSRRKKSAAGNRFNNFPQRSYDYDELEKRMTEGRKENG